MVESLLSVTKRWRIIKLSDVLMETKGVKALVRTLGDNYVIHLMEGDRCSYHPLPPNFETFLAQLSRNRRKTFAKP